MESYKRIKWDLIREGIRQIEVAHILGWDPSRLSKILNGWRPMSKEAERQIIHAVNVIKGKHERSE